MVQVKEELTDFTKEEKYLVKKIYEDGYTVFEIMNGTGLSFYEVISILVRMKDDLNLKKLLPYDTIHENKVLILSDTHLGSIYENLDYLDVAYQYAKERKIHTTFHTGDLMQSTFRNVQGKYQDEEKQLKHIQKEYPFSSDMKNYILLGNHDYNTLKKDAYYFDILKEREDFHLMGFKRAYISWNDQLFSLYHTTKKYHISIPNIETVLSFKGHSHKLSYKKLESIDVPTLSDDLLHHGKSKPGFLIGTLDSQCLQIKSFYFNKNGICEEEGSVFEKKIKM